MKFSRRDFLKVGAAGSAAGVTSFFVTAPKADAGPYGPDHIASANLRRADENGLPSISLGTPSPNPIGEGACVPTSCLQCVAICGVMGFREGSAERGRITKIEGNPHSPNNRGMTCAKAQAGMNQVYDPDRILYPLRRVGKRGEGKWKRVSWGQALDEVASKMKECLDDGKPEEIMFHYGRSRIKPWIGQFWTNALGTKTIGNHTSICEVAKWTAQELSFEKHFDVNDVEHANFILNFGCNPVESHTSHSYFCQRIVDAVVDRKVRMVTFDVRASNTASWGSEWIPIRPGTDSAIILAMCKVILDEGLHNKKFIEEWTTATEKELKEHLEPFTPEFAEQESGVSAADIRRLAIEYAKAKPGTCITYRGFVGHYNGTHNEIASKMLDAVCGYIGVKGGTNPKTGGKWEDPFKGIAKKVGAAKPKKLKIVDGEKVILPTHHVNHRVLEMIAEGSHGRPRVYFTYTYNPAYVNGDCARNIEILKDEKLIPFYVACDVAMSESSALADLILPDSTYLERWTSEAPQSYSFTKFVQIRQPVTEPLGEARDFQQIMLDLAKKIGGKVSELLHYDTVEEYYREAVAATAGKHKAYGVDGQPLKSDPFEYITKYGFIYQSTSPSHQGFLKEKTPGESDIVDEATGVVWNPGKAHVSDEDVEAKGYAGSKNAYKGYVGQKVGEKVYAGFKPDKINKSGRIEIKSRFLMPGTPSGDKVQSILGAQLSQVMKSKQYAYLERHLKSGLPTYIPIPEHVQRSDGELIMTSFKINVQIHSRSQNCKWLSELYHDNPAWINTATAKRLGIGDGDSIRITYADKSYPEKAYSPPKQTSITTKARVTEMVHPDVVAVSFHCGHWAYGRYASGKPVGTDGVAGTKRDADGDGTDWKKWSHGEHPNWIIPNAPDPISGQWRSNDTVVKVAKA